MEDDLNLLENERRPQLWGNGKPLQSLENGKRPQYMDKWKTTSIFSQ
jgi:hypothetical protein